MQESRKTELCKTRVVRPTLSQISFPQVDWKLEGSRDWGLHWEGCVGTDGCMNACLVVKSQPREVETTEVYFRNSGSPADAALTVLLNVV